MLTAHVTRVSASQPEIFNSYIRVPGLLYVHGHGEADAMLMMTEQTALSDIWTLKEDVSLAEIAAVFR